MITTFHEVTINPNLRLMKVNDPKARELASLPLLRYRWWRRDLLYISLASSQCREPRNVLLRAHRLRWETLVRVQAWRCA